MDFGSMLTGQPTGQQSYGMGQQVPPQQSNGFFSSFSTQQSPIASQITAITPKLSSQNPQEVLAASEQVKALANTQAKLSESQLGLSSGMQSHGIPPRGMPRPGMVPGGMGASGMGAHGMVSAYGGKRHRTHRKRKQRGGSCGHGVASHAATFKGGRRRHKKRSYRRSHRRR